MSQNDEDVHGQQQQYAQALSVSAMGYDSQPQGHLNGGQQNPMLAQFWADQMALIEDGPLDFKQHQLPLARIKKVMKTDEDVRSKMISAEVPVLFAKACEIFTLELTMRAWIHTEQNKRRTLQRSDIAAAISKTDVFDFLIDIIPRETKKLEELRTFMAPEYQQYYQSMLGQFPANALAQADPNMIAYQQQLQMQQYRMGTGQAGLPDETQSQQDHQ